MPTHYTFDEALNRAKEYQHIALFDSDDNRVVTYNPQGDKPRFTDIKKTARDIGAGYLSCKNSMRGRPVVFWFSDNPQPATVQVIKELSTGIPADTMEQIRELHAELVQAQLGQQKAEMERDQWRKMYEALDAQFDELGDEDPKEPDKPHYVQLAESLIDTLPSIMRKKHEYEQDGAYNSHIEFLKRHDPAAAVEMIKQLYSIDYEQDANGTEGPDQ